MVNYSAVPSLVNYRKITLIVNVGTCASVSVTADGAAVSATYNASAGTATFTTTGSSIDVTAVNWTSGGTGSATKATLYNNYHWAYSLTFDDNRLSQYDYGKPLLDAMGWRAGEAVVGSWANGGGASGSGSYFMNWACLQAMRAAGWDMLDHSYDHPNPLTCNGTATDIGPELSNNQPLLLKYFPGYNVTQMVFPYENSSANTCSGYPPSYLLSAECGGGSYNYVDTTPLPFQFQRGGMFGTNDTAWKSLAASAAGQSRSTWLIEYTHSVAQGSGAAADTYSTNQATLQDLFTYLNNNFGTPGNKSMWFAPAGEVRDYLFARDNAVVTTCTPAVTPTPTSTASMTPTASFTATRTTSPTASFTMTSTPTRTNTPTTTVTASSTASRTPTASATFTATMTNSNTPTKTSTATSTPTSTSSSTPSHTMTSSATETNTRTCTATETATDTSSPTGTTTDTPTSTSTLTPTNMGTPSFTSTGTLSPTPTSTVTLSSTPTATITDSLTFSPTPTLKSTNTVTFTNSFTPTSTLNASSTNTSSPTPTITNSPTATSTATHSPTSTATITLTFTPTPTNTSTATKTYTPSMTNSATNSFTSTPTATSSSTPTSTPTSSFTPTMTHTFTSTSTLTVTPIPTSSHTPTATASRTMTAAAMPGGKPTPIIFPNPVPGGMVNILPPPYNGLSDVRVEIFTLAFRKVQDRTFIDIPPGTAVTIALTDRWGSPLASGIYYVVVTTHQGRSFGKLLILR